jgi:hypothetical protein
MPSYLKMPSQTHAGAHPLVEPVETEDGPGPTNPKATSQTHAGAHPLVEPVETEDRPGPTNPKATSQTQAGAHPLIELVEIEDGRLTICRWITSQIRAGLDKLNRRGKDMLSRRGSRRFSEAAFAGIEPPLKRAQQSFLAFFLMKSWRTPNSLLGNALFHWSTNPGRYFTRRN